MGIEVERAAQSILVVDDEDYVADMLATALDIEGYDVVVAYNGREGLERARDLVIDMAILDIMMPYLNGVALIEELRSIEGMRDLPVVLISAGARPPSVLTGVTFIPKPFDLDEILGTVQRALEERGSQA